MKVLLNDIGQNTLTQFKKVTVASKGEVLICYREGYKKVFMKDIN